MSTLDIEWRHLEVGGNTCARCDDTGAVLKATLARLGAELASAGHALNFRETMLGPGSLSESNLILINGRPLEDWLGAQAIDTACASCGDMLGAEVCCRAVEHGGELHEAIPEALIRSAALAALSKEIPVMKHIKVLGSGCRNCETTAKLIQEVATAHGVAIELEKVSDMADILGYGVMSTPGVVIDGQLVHAGGVPDRKKVEAWLAT